PRLLPKHSAHCACPGGAAELGMTGTAIAQGLETARLSAMRLQIQQVTPYVIINDAYNANPASTKAALEVLAGYPCKGKRVAVLGNMLELGEEAERGHRSVGQVVVSRGIDVLYTLGDLAGWIGQEALECGMAPQAIRTAGSCEEISASLRELLQPGDVLLVKGSRGMKMEEIINQL
ncbi:MAG TPA: cyanophycin synthetase, partial [Bacillota bacterium]|nr:cyanophycin synthetase [Bacillota bacterium]